MTTIDEIRTDPEKAHKVWVKSMARGDDATALMIEKMWGLVGLSPEYVSEKFNELAKGRPRS